jgi:methionyl-tRNA formyltransferase
MRIVFMGTPGFAVPVLKELVAEGHDIAAVYTRPDKEAGRGRRAAAPAVKKLALDLELPLEQPPALTNKEVQQKLASYKADVFVVAAYGLMLPASVLQIPLLGCLNIHPSLLPRHRGPSPIAAAVLAGDEFSGTSIMLLDEGMDTGPLFTRFAIPVNDSDNTITLSAKLALLSAQLLGDLLARGVDELQSPQPQNNAGASYSHLAKKEDGKINFKLSAAEIWRRVRAYQPWPGAWCRWEEKLLKITEAVPLPAVENIKLGEVTAGEDKTVIIIGTGEGALGVKTLQLEGKKEMTAAEFLRGQPGFIGARLC